MKPGNTTPAPVAAGRGLHLVSVESELQDSSTDARLLDYRSVAGRLGLPVGTVRSMVNRRQIPFVRLGARIVRFEREAIAAFIASRSVGVGGGNDQGY